MYILLFSEHMHAPSLLLKIRIKTFFSHFGNNQRAGLGGVMGKPCFPQDLPELLGFTLVNTARICLSNSPY
jgi:hypothetical protein